MQQFQIQQNENEIILSEDSNHLVLKSGLSKNKTMELLRKYIKENSTVRSDVDYVVRKIETNSNWSCLFFKNKEDEIILTIDFKNDIILNLNEIEATKTYCYNLVFNIHDIEIKELWVTNFINLLQSSFIQPSDRDISLNTYFRQAVKDFNKLKTIEIFAKQGFRKENYYKSDHFNKVYTHLNNKEKFKFHELFGLTKSQYILCKEKDLINDREYLQTFVYLLNHDAKIYIEYLIRNYDCNSYTLRKFSDTILTNDYMVKNYDLYKLIDYFYIDCDHQGISESYEAMKYLSDYVNMNRDMQIKDFIKYPRYLKTYHDIVAKNYKVKINEIKNNKYNNELKRKYSYLQFSKNKEYEVIIPETLNDIVIEGSTLNHCVASYVDKVVEDKSFICFMRKKKEIDKSLITLEIVNNHIVHMKGQSNRSPFSEEESFLKEYQSYIYKNTKIENIKIGEVIE